MRTDPILLEDLQKKGSSWAEAASEGPQTFKADIVAVDEAEGEWIMLATPPGWPEARIVPAEGNASLFPRNAVGRSARVRGQARWTPVEGEALDKLLVASGKVATKSKSGAQVYLIEMEAISVGIEPSKDLEPPRYRRRAVTVDAGPDAAIATPPVPAP